MFKPKIWKTEIYRGFRYHITYGNHGRKYEKPMWYRNKSHCRRQWNPYQKKLCGWHGYQKCEGKIHRVTLSDMDVITGLHESLFNMTLNPQKNLQVMSEGEDLILQKIPPKFVLTRKWKIAATKDLFWPPSSTRIQIMSLFWTLRSGNRKVRHP